MQKIFILYKLILKNYTIQVKVLKEIRAPMYSIREEYMYMKSLHGRGESCKTDIRKIIRSRFILYSHFDCPPRDRRSDERFIRIMFLQGQTMRIIFNFTHPM